VLSKTQLICETLFPLWMSVTIKLYIAAIAVVTKAPPYLFIACQSHNASKFNRLYLRHF